MLTIEPVVPEDIENLLAIQKDAFLDEARVHDDFTIAPLTETPEQALRSLREERIFKAVLDGRFAGSIRVRCTGAVCLLGRLSVDPKLQGRGIGSALLDFAERAHPAAKVAELFTGYRSERNLHLYQSRGYERVGERVISPKLTLVVLRKNLVH